LKNQYISLWGSVQYLNLKDVLFFHFTVNTIILYIIHRIYVIALTCCVYLLINAQWDTPQRLYHIILLYISCSDGVHRATPFKMLSSSFFFIWKSVPLRVPVFDKNPATKYNAFHWQPYAYISYNILYIVLRGKPFMLYTKLWAIFIAYTYSDHNLEILLFRWNLYRLRFLYIIYFFPLCTKNCHSFIIVFLDCLTRARKI